MNIFVLDESPVTSARYLCDKHVVKMITESVQMLCLPVPVHLSPYKHTHANHPCSVWARKTKANYQWLIDHAEAIGNEYSFRYKRTHKSSRVLHKLLRLNPLQYIQPGQLTPFAQTMPDEYKHSDPVTAYRQFYLNDKVRFAVWNKGRAEPYWWK